MLLFIIQVCSYLIAIPLQIRVVAALLRGPYRRFPFVFLYAIAGFLATIAEVPLYLSYYSGNKASQQKLVKLYWLNEGILQVLVYVLVMSLLYYATAAIKPRKVVRGSLIWGAVLFAAVSFLIHYDPAAGRKIGTWMTPWTRDLNVCAEILDLTLWAMLLARRDRDHRLLMLSGALGIKFTGEAIGAALRHVADLRNQSRTFLALGAAIGMVSYIIFLYVLLQTFKPQQAAKKEKPPPTKRLSD
jgi:hypothetical protein